MVFANFAQKAWPVSLKLIIGCSKAQNGHVKTASDGSCRQSVKHSSEQAKDSTGLDRMVACAICKMCWCCFLQDACYTWLAVCFFPSHDGGVGGWYAQPTGVLRPSFTTRCAKPALSSERHWRRCLSRGCMRYQNGMIEVHMAETIGSGCFWFRFLTIKMQIRWRKAKSKGLCHNPISRLLYSWRLFLFTCA